MDRDDYFFVIDTISSSAWHMQALRAVRRLELPDWAVGAGFVRNAVWDRLHDYEAMTPLSDIDVLYFDAADLRPDRDQDIENTLYKLLPGRPWSVRNQARMHVRNADRAYSSTADAISFWLETPTGVAVRLDADDAIEVIAPFGLSDLVAMRAMPTASGLRRHGRYLERMTAKNWPHIWPKVKVGGLG